MKLPCILACVLSTGFRVHIKCHGKIDDYMTFTSYPVEIIVMNNQIR